MLIAWILISSILILTLAIPLIPSQYWLVKALEYPMLQQFFLTITLLLLGLFIRDHTSVPGTILMGLLVIAFIYQILKIAPYTPAFHPEMKGNFSEPESGILSIYISNVYQYNTKYQKVYQQIDNYNPDFIVLLETNKNWADNLAPLRKKYNSVEYPLENTYGILFYSRHEIIDSRIHFHVKKDIPSIECVIKLKEDENIKFWIVHPEPPFPGESENTEKKDKELIQIAKRIRIDTLPSIVAGDLNDVAWSRTTQLFKKLSNMLDPRIGRGLYNTFHAKIPLLRFPLDHIFFSTEFKLISMERGSKNGSDHFPLHITATYHTDHTHDQHPNDINKEDQRDIREILQK